MLSVRVNSEAIKEDTCKGRLATSRPLGARSESFLAAKQQTASDDRSPTKDFFESLMQRARLLPFRRARTPI